MMIILQNVGKCEANFKDLTRKGVGDECYEKIIAVRKQIYKGAEQSTGIFGRNKSGVFELRRDGQNESGVFELRRDNVQRRTR